MKTSVVGFQSSAASWGAPALLALSLVLTPAGHLSAGIVRWTGAGGDDLWSDSVNWQGGVSPVNGDDVVFGANAKPQAELNYSLQLGSFTYDTAATLTAIHVGAGTASTLTLSGVGLVNNSPFVSGQNPQDFFADASSGPTGGTLLFTNTASVMGSVTTTLTASGATVAGGGGGTIIFQDHASTSSAGNFTGLVAEGATVAGAGGGTVILRDDARAQDHTQIVARGGVGVNAAGGQFTVQDRAEIDANITLLQGGNGFGGRLDVLNNALLKGGLLENFGAATALAGGEAVTRFFNNGTFSGAAENYAGGGAGFAGGRMEFHDHSLFASGVNSVQIVNLGSSVAGAGGSRTLFYDDSSIAGTAVFIDNDGGGESNTPGVIGGSTEFHDRSHAGQVSISNAGASTTGSGTLGGRTSFFDVSSAESARIENFGGDGAGSPGGVTLFANNSTAASATLLADSGTNGGNGGQIVFQDSASGGTARIVVNAGASFDLSALTTAGTTVGSLEGAGSFFLGGKLLVVGGNNLSTEVTGAITDGGQAGGAGGALTKVGTGTLTLSGANTYTGATAVNTGALYVNGSLGGTGVNVVSGAKLGGTGTINAPVAIAGGATLAPGGVAAPGALTVNGDLTLNAASTLNLRLGAAGVVGGPKNDLLAVSGNLTLAGTLNVADSGGFGVGSYRLINYGGALANNGLSLGAFPAGFLTSDFTIQTGAGQVNLVIGGANVLFWDGAGTVANNVVNGGTGTWNNATTNWTNAGGTGNGAWGNRFAVFSGTAGTVTVTEPVTSTGMQFTRSGYTVNAAAGGSIALVGAATIRTDPGTATTINAPLTGSGSLTKLDTGTLTLGGNSTYTGGTTIQDGLVIVTNAAGQGLGTGPVTLFATVTAELDFVGNASAGGITLTNLGAPSTAVSAFTQFKDTATAGTATINNRGNTANGGIGGQVNFSTSSSAGNATITNAGSAFAPPVGAFANNGAGITLFLDNATAGGATLLNTGSLASGALSGRVLFADSSTAGTGIFVNQGSGISGGYGGLVSFRNTSTAGAATFTNGDAANFGSSGIVEFRDSSNAGTASFTNVAATLARGTGGITIFYDNASAGAGTFHNTGGAVANTFSDSTIFFNNATAANATLTSDGASVADGRGGFTQLPDTATGGSATFIANGATAAGGERGSVYITTNSTAGNATLVANGGTNGGDGGFIAISENASGGTARAVINAGGVLDLSALMATGSPLGSLEGAGSVFLGSKVLTVGGRNTSTTFAGTIADGGQSGGAGGSLTKTGTGTLTLTGASTYTGGTRVFAGILEVQSTGGAGLGIGSAYVNPSAQLNFTNNALAGVNTIFVNPSSVATTYGGLLQFSGNSSAGSATINQFGTTQANVYTEAQTLFSGQATAGSATINNLGGNGAMSAYGGVLRFSGIATAGNANITNQGATIAGASFGYTAFDTAGTSAGSATFTNLGTATIDDRGSNNGGTLYFLAGTAANATITNGGATGAGGSVGETNFYNTADGGASNITNQGGLAAGRLGGLTTFRDHSSAGNSTITTQGGAVSGASGGLTYFSGSSTAGNATLYAGSAPLGAPGGSVIFELTSSGGTARAIIQGGAGLSPGGLDLSQLTSSGITIGSIEGGGIVSLGSKKLTVGGNGLGTTFSGLIRDGGFANGTGGALAVAGPGASLRLTGPNTYTGGTAIGDGTNANSGKLIAANGLGSATGTGPVSVNRGGTLSGSGFIAGPVTLRAGGAIVPGDPVTLTLDDSLTWDAGGVITLVLGENTASSDRLDILGALVRGDLSAGGGFTIDLLDGGIVLGQTYDLLHYSSLQGFSPGDFTLTGATGDFALANGALSLTVTGVGVPEPGTWSLLLAGGILSLLVPAGARRREV